MKGLPIGYSKDLQEDKEALFEAEDTLRASLGATSSVVARNHHQSRRRGTRRVGTAACDRRRRLPRSEGRAFPRRARDRRRAGAAARARRTSFDELTIDEWRSHSPLFESGRPSQSPLPPRSGRSVRRSRRIRTRSPARSPSFSAGCRPSNDLSRSSRGRRRAGRRRPATSSRAGSAHAERLARDAAAARCEAGRIWHSGKLRARQTAEAFLRACNPLAEFRRSAACNLPIRPGGSAIHSTRSPRAMHARRPHATPAARC